MTLVNLPPAINDAMSDAIPTTSLPFADERALHEASYESGEPDCLFTASVWYEIEPTQDTDIRVTLEDRSIGDFSISIYESTDDGLESLGCYRIQEGPDNAGFVVVDAELEGPLPGASNGRFVNAMEVSLPATDRRLTFDAVTEVFDNWCSANRLTVWYRFVAPEDGVVIADRGGSNFHTRLGAYVGVLSELTRLACTTSVKAIFSVEKGKVYFVQVGGHAGAAGALSLDMRYQQSLRALRASRQQAPR